MFGAAANTSDLGEIFDVMDTDGDGAICADDLAKVYLKYWRIFQIRFQEQQASRSHRSLFSEFCVGFDLVGTGFDMWGVDLLLERMLWF